MHGYYASHTIGQATTGSHTLSYIEERNTPVDAGIKCIYDTSHCTG